MTRVLQVLPALLVGAVLVGCSSDSTSAGSSDTSSAASSISEETAAVCSSVDTLQTSVAALGDVQVTEEGVPALQDAVASVERDLGQVRDDATSRYAAQVDQLQTAFDAVQSAVGAAVDAPSADTLRAVGASVDAFADAVTGFADDVRSEC